MENKEFYNEYYSKEKEYNDNGTLEGKIFRFLSKYNLSRYVVIANLIDSFNLKKINILDLGCGEGSFFSYLHGDYNLYGLDIAGVRLQKITNGKYNIVEGDLDKKFPFENNYFDIITSMSVMEHVFSVENHLLESHRILKKGGKFILEVPNVGFLPNRLRLLFGNTPITGDWSEAWDDNHLHYFTKDNLKKYLEKYGFKVEKISGTGIFAGIRKFWPSLLCGDLIFVCTKKD